MIMMKYNLSDTMFSYYQRYIKDKCGIYISSDKKYLIETRLAGLLAEYNAKSFDELYYAIINNNNALINEKIINAITTNETQWFRDKKPWIIIEDILMPKFIQQLKSREKSMVRFWSAAASSGQEAYSTAMCINEYLIKNSIKDIGLSSFEITATDVSRDIVSKARQGIYDNATLSRGLREDYRKKYFSPHGKSWVITNKIKNAVYFSQFNLQDSFQLIGDKFDVIFLRYVLIYFCDEFKSEVIKKIYDALPAGGVLFLGSSEFYNGLDRIFEPVSHKDGYYYIKL